MPAYHSAFLDTNPQVLGNFALPPLRTRTRGPAQTLPPLQSPETALDICLDTSHPSYDPVDEALALFRANVLFRNFEILGPADRTLIYGILFTSQLLSVVKPNMPRREAERAMMNLALDNNFRMPGDAGFPLNQAFEAPKDRVQAETMRGYITQMRQELAARLLERVYAGSDTPSKFWLSFTKRKFIGKSL